MAYIQDQSKHLGSVSFPSLGRSDTVADIPAKPHKEVGEGISVIDDPDQTVICLSDCKKHLGGNIALFVLDPQESGQRKTSKGRALSRPCFSYHSVYHSNHSHYYLRVLRSRPMFHRIGLLSSVTCSAYSSGSFYSIKPCFLI